MPYYNRPKDLVLALKSLQNQTHKNWKFAFVDDGSDEPGDLIVKSFFNEEDLKTRKGVLSEIRRIYSMKSLTDPSGNRLILQQKYNQKHYEAQDSLQSWLTSESIGVFETQKDDVCSIPVKNPAIEARLKGSFDEILATAVGNTVKPDEGGNEIKNETLDQLKSLGYLQ